MVRRAGLARLGALPVLNPAGFFHGSPAAATVGGIPVIVLGNGTIVRATDGKVLYGDRDAGNQAVASAVVELGTLYAIGR